MKAATFLNGRKVV